MKKSFTCFSLILFILYGCNKTTSDVNKYDLSLIPFKQNDKWGYIDKKGVIIINPQFDVALLFNDKIALVKSSDDKWGFINSEGKFVINPIYKYASGFSEGLAVVVSENNHPELINSRGETIATLNDIEYVRPFKEGMAAIAKNDLWGFINTKGEVIIQPLYKEVGSFSDGLVSFLENTKENKETLYGYIDKAGKIIINPQFKYASDFNDGLALTSNGKQYGYIDKEGKYAINPQFKQAKSFSDGYAFVSNEDSWGMIDKKGKYIFNPQFKNVPANFLSELIPVKSVDDKVGYTTKEGKFEINPQFENGSCFYDNIAFVKSADKWGIIDKKGTYLVNPQFDQILYPEIGKYYEVLTIETDFFNVSALVNSLKEGSSGNSFYGLTTNAIYKDVNAKFPGYMQQNLQYYTYETDIELSKEVKIDNIVLSFFEVVNGQQATYRTVQKYDRYRGGYVSQQEFSGYSNVYNENAKFNAATFSINLKGKATNKIDEIYIQLQSELITACGLTASEMSNENSSVKYVYLKNDKMQIVLSYSVNDKSRLSIAYSVFDLGT